MSDSRFAILDPAAGISGDMLLGALIDSGASEQWLRTLPSRLGIPEVTIEIESVLRCSIRSTKVHVRTPGGVESPGEAHADLRASSQHHHGPHRHLGELLAIVDRAPLSEWVRKTATHAFELLGEAEGKVHGVAPENVSLHEVGALDALVDVVGSIEGFEQLGIREVATRPVTLGAGWISAAHGVLPVPAPATSLLLEGLTIGPDGPVTGEATTPTGAALLRSLVSRSIPVRWRMVRQGWGAGGRNPLTYPNALRLLIAEPAEEPAEVVMIVTDVDDLAPEYLEPLREGLTAAGAIDVQIWTTQMKKGRIGFRVEAVTTASRAADVTEAFFRHSTTAGVRSWVATRVTLPRHTVAVPQGDDCIRVKVRGTPDGPRIKPEFDDVAAAARESGRPAIDIADAVRAHARSTRELWTEPAAPHHKESE